MSRTHKYSSGLLQQIESTPTGFTIHDQIHGTFSISEPLLVALLQTQAVQRIRGIYQHGVTALLGFGPPVTRLEHSVGAMLIVRRAGGSVEEQAFGLLHDVSHTSLSHVVDWAFSKPGESYHEVHLERYVESTELPGVLTAHGLHLPECIDESLFPLVEQPSPHLCADRLDYALRDAVAFGKLDIKDAEEVSRSLVAFPHFSSSKRLLTLKDQGLASILARSYLATDRDVWSNPAHVDLYRRTGNIIRDVIGSGKLTEASLWKFSDTEFWEKLREAGTADQQADMARMEATVLEEHRVSSLPPRTKIRTIDPDIFVGHGDEPVPLSALDDEYLDERQRYIDSRNALMAR